MPRGAGAPGTGSQHAAAAPWTRVCAEPPSLAELPEKGDSIRGDPATPPAASSHVAALPTAATRVYPKFIPSLFPPWDSGLWCFPAGTQVSQLPQESRRLLAGTDTRRLPPAPLSRYAGPRWLSCPPASRGFCGGRGAPGPRPDTSATEGGGSKGIQTRSWSPGGRRQW